MQISFADAPARAALPRDPSFDGREEFVLRCAGRPRREGLRFLARPGALALWADRACLAGDPRGVALEAGAALLDVAVAAARFGTACDVAVAPDPKVPGHLADIRLLDRPDEPLARLFPALAAAPSPGPAAARGREIAAPGGGLAGWLTAGMLARRLELAAVVEARPQ